MQRKFQRNAQKCWTECNYDESKFTEPQLSRAKNTDSIKCAHREKGSVSNKSRKLLPKEPRKIRDIQTQRQQKEGNNKEQKSMTSKIGKTLRNINETKKMFLRKDKKLTFRQPNWQKINKKARNYQYWKWKGDITIYPTCIKQIREYFKKICSHKSSKLDKVDQFL